MVRIRMKRTGRTNAPFYRIQVIDKRARRDGAPIEQLGWYNPLEKNADKQITLNEERCKYWIGVGAQPSETVKDMFAKRNLIKTEAYEKIRARQRKTVQDQQAAAAAAAAAPADAKKPE